MEHILSAFDNTLSRVKANRLLEAVLTALASGRESLEVRLEGSVEEMVKLYKEELALIAKALKQRSRVQELLIELEPYAKFKNDVVSAYSAKLGLHPGDKPRLRICRNYGNESVCIATAKTTYWIGDNAIYGEFKKYLELKKAVLKEVKQCKQLLNQLLESNHAWVRKLLRHLLRELKDY